MQVCFAGMSAPLPSRRPPVRSASIWALLLFLALLRGLLPPMAVAAVLSDGSPQIIFCAPGSQAPIEAGGTEQRLSTHGHCLCASPGDPLLSVAMAALPTSSQAGDRTVPASPVSESSPHWRLPPVRGPPL